MSRLSILPQWNKYNKRRRRSLEKTTPYLAAWFQVKALDVPAILSIRMVAAASQVGKAQCLTFA
jgi:hypothetical protein